MGFLKARSLAVDRRVHLNKTLLTYYHNWLRSWTSDIVSLHIISASEQNPLTKMIDATLGY